MNDEQNKSWGDEELSEVLFLEDYLEERGTLPQNVSCNGKNIVPVLLWQMRMTR